jgi:hypothetical protein
MVDIPHGWEQLIADALELGLAADDWPRSWDWSVAVSHRPSNRKATSNHYFGPLDLSTHGKLAEVAFARFLGLDPEALGAWVVGAHGETGVPDVAGYEVKSQCWRSIESQVTWHGGRLWVQAEVESPVVVSLSLFEATRARRVYLDGWVPMSRVRAAGRRVPGKGGRGISFEVPYYGLRSWRTLPRLDPSQLPPRRPPDIAERMGLGLWDRRPRWD